MYRNIGHIDIKISPQGTQYDFSGISRLTGYSGQIVLCYLWGYCNMKMWFSSPINDFWFRVSPLQWRQNERDVVSNHQPCDCLLNRLSWRRSKKTSKLRVTGLCAGNSRGSNAEMFPLDDVIFSAEQQHACRRTLLAPISKCKTSHKAAFIETKYRHFDEIIIPGCSGGCYHKNFQCSIFHQNEDISVPVLAVWVIYKHVIFGLIQWRERDAVLPVYL